MNKMTFIDTYIIVSRKGTEGQAGQWGFTQSVNPNVFLINTSKYIVIH